VRAHAAILVAVSSTGVTFSEPVRTHRLLIRPLGEPDVDALVSYRSRPDVCRCVPVEPMDAETVRARLESHWSKLTLEKEGDFVTLGVELAATGELVGDVMMHWSSDTHRSAEIGYVFHPAHSGHGYATESAHRLLHVIFDDLGLHRVTARVDARNAASARVVTRLGMRREAHLVENEWFKGCWSDELDFALLDREWEAGHAEGCPFPLLG